MILLQGMTIRPLVDLLHVKRKRESAPTVGEQIHIRVSKESNNTWLELLKGFAGGHRVLLQCNVPPGLYSPADSC